MSFTSSTNPKYPVSIARKSGEVSVGLLRHPFGKKPKLKSRGEINAGSSIFGVGEGEGVDGETIGVSLNAIGAVTEIRVKRIRALIRGSHLADFTSRLFLAGFLIRE
jgi:hypothetical protein